MELHKLYIETTTHCNLQCGMCVKQAAGSTICDHHFDRRLFPRITTTLPGLKALVVNGIGEPLLYPHLLELIAFAAPHMQPDSWIGFQTNGLLLTEDNTRQLMDAGLTRLCISVDSTAADPGCSNSLMHPHQERQPLPMVRRICDEGGYDRMRLGAEAVLMKETIHQLPELIRRLANQGADFILCSHLLAYQDGAEQHSLFSPCTVEALALFRKWRDRAAREGLQLTELTAKTWIAPRHEHEHRLLALYREMLAEAKAQDIWLNVQRLADVDENASSQAQRYLDEAQAEAQRLGVELSLPPLHAPMARSCRFMDDGATFVDVAGSVTPCHSLWHNQTVYMEERAKYIPKQSFGSLTETDLLDIWNLPAYREFRQSSLRYDFPFCHSCAVGPCTDILGEYGQPAEDCFASGVPCGHCLWCYDAVRCL